MPIQETTRITNGASREHATEWSIGEASGTLAAFSLARGQPPSAVRDDSMLLSDLQRTLERSSRKVSFSTGRDSAH